MGILKVNHLIDNGHWREVKEICRTYGLPELLFSFKFALLKRAFPCSWLQRMRDGDVSLNIHVGCKSQGIQTATKKLLMCLV